MGNTKPILYHANQAKTTETIISENSKREPPATKLPPLLVSCFYLCNSILHCRCKPIPPIKDQLPNLSQIRYNPRKSPPGGDRQKYFFMEKTAQGPSWVTRMRVLHFKVELTGYQPDCQSGCRENRKISGSPPERPSLRNLFLHKEWQRWQHSIGNKAGKTLLWWH